MDSSQRASSARPSGSSGVSHRRIARASASWARVRLSMASTRSHARRARAGSFAFWKASAARRSDDGVPRARYHSPAASCGPPRAELGLGAFLLDVVGEEGSRRARAPGRRATRSRSRPPVPAPRAPARTGPRAARASSRRGGASIISHASSHRSSRTASAQAPACGTDASGTLAATTGVIDAVGEGLGRGGS